VITKQLRNTFANVSTSNGNYFPTKGHGICAFEAVLIKSQLLFDNNQFAEFNGDEGHQTLTVVDVCNHEVGKAKISWFRMPSGRYEFTGYIA